MSNYRSNLLNNLESAFIVSCQALENEPLFGSNIMAAMAVAAQQGGARGIRANTPSDISAIKAVCPLPLIGLYKKNYPDSEVYITPTCKEAVDVALAGADIIATDATTRRRPNGDTLENIVAEIRSHFPDKLIMADVSTYEEGVHAMEMGFDLISTTLSGYTPYSRQHEEPDINLVARLAELRRVPVLAEGRITTPDEALACLNAGAYAVVVGGAITRPQEIVKKYVCKLESALGHNHVREKNI